ncbi:hypothetical protein Gohar_025850 [Gossypium harknessii]|uniref:Uncharacterized protein n=1 Tax=Gossypium harknessii TaxID=34285 RepID=A0A7J9HSI8_9ROSI|nr:hypothetical protein [Gossypium harknessii]
MTLYLMLITIKLEQKHKVLNPTDLISMEPMVVELIMPSIGRSRLGTVLGIGSTHCARR